MQELKDLRKDVSEIKADVGEIKVTLARNTASLEQHMIRTELNENRIQKLEYWLLGALLAIIFFLAKNNL